MYDVTPTLAVYANTARSYKPNTGAKRLGGGFDPEKGRSNEVGMKWEALDRTVSVQGALYHTVKQNVQTVDPVDSSYRLATGEVRSQGVDLNVIGNMTPAWRVIAGYALVDAEVTKDNVAPAGTRLANIPRTMASLLNVYTFQDGPARGLGLGAGIKHTSDRAASTGTGAYTMKRYTVVDLLAFYEVNKKLRVNLDVKNLFNKDYDEGSFQSYVYPGVPRTVQVGMAYTF
jgi:iron complex outermembrane receptor protein